MLVAEPGKLQKLPPDGSSANEPPVALVRIYHLKAMHAHGAMQIPCLHAYRQHITGRIVQYAIRRRTEHAANAMAPMAPYDD